MKLQAKALRMGYVNHKRIREGQVFSLSPSMMTEKSKLKSDYDVTNREFVKISGKEYMVPKWCEILDGKQKPSAEPAEEVSPQLMDDEVI